MKKDSYGNKIGDKKTIIKILAGYHQYFAVKKALENTKIAISAHGDRKIGVV
jgi:type I restriction enzyme R subunit